MVARLVVAGTSSGAGKTTVASGLMAALRARGLVVQGAKVGPDFIDPSYHELATGRPGRNLDAFLQGPELVAPLLAHAAGPVPPLAEAAGDDVSRRPADVVVCEGVMGLFDGASGRGELASTAHVAKLTGSPVVLVVDAAAMARSVAAIVLGYRDYDPEVHVAGVVLNRAGSDWHAELLREAIAPLGVPVLGALRRDDAVHAPSRHLGLVPVAERAREAGEAIDALGARVAADVDLDAVLALARGAGPLDAAPWAPASALALAAAGPAATGSAASAAAATRRPVRIAFAAGAAFTFRYVENLELLAAAGAELVPLDPLRDAALPDGTDALYLGGGFPEQHGEGLAANAPLREAVAAHARAGRPVVAECGGLLYLAERLDGHAMCGVLRGAGHLGERLALGYREAIAAADSPCWRAGEAVRGHEFHYSGLEPAASAPPAWDLRRRGVPTPEGHVALGGVHASYLHTHWAAYPQAAARLVAAAAAAR